jgi:hypothetical protein
VDLEACAQFGLADMAESPAIVMPVPLGVFHAKDAQGAQVLLQRHHREVHQVFRGDEELPTPLSAEVLRKQSVA